MITKTSQLPWATLTLSLLLVWVYAWSITLSTEEHLRALVVFGVFPDLLSGRKQLPAELTLISPPWSLLSSLFLHSSFATFAANLTGLFLFAPCVERAAPGARLITLFVASGILAGLMVAAFNPSVATIFVGSGAAISGLAGAYLVLHPRASNNLALSTLTPLPGWMAVSAWTVWIALGPTAYPVVFHLLAALTGALLIMFIKIDSARLFEA